MKSGITDETLSHFLAGIHLSLEKIGVNQTKVRFRQHMANEMALSLSLSLSLSTLTTSGMLSF